MPKLEVRSAQANDADNLARLFRQLGYPEARDGLDERLEDILGDPRAEVFIAQNGQYVVGTVALFIVPVAHESGAWCRVTALVVDEDNRGRGIGEALMAAAESAARAAGCIRVEATSALDRLVAHEFYAALGYARESNHFLKRL
jgi:aminoglycoside 6'-N-acetyltransferase I